MKHQTKNKNENIISLDSEDFASLIDFGQKVVYEFRYSINIPAALKAGAQKVEISTFTSSKPKPPSIFTSNSISNKPSSLTLVKNIQQITAVKKDIKNANTNAKFSNSISDFTTKASNDSLFSSFKNKVFKLALAPSINQKKAIEPILKISNFPSSSIIQSPKSLSVKGILQNKQDPSNIQASFSVGASKAIQGVITPSQTSLKTLPLSSLKISQKILKQKGITTSQQASDNTIIPILVQEDTNFANVKKIIEFEPNTLGNSPDFIVQFSLLGVNGLVIEKIQRTVEHSQNIRVIQTPTIPPVVSSVTLPARNLLTIIQKDPLAKSVDIFRKIFNRTQRLEEQKYTFVANVPVDKMKGPVPFEDLIGNASDIIYRVIPKGGQQQLGSVFTNKVVNAYRFGLSRERTSRLLYAGIVAQSDPKGIKIDVFSLPPGVSAIKLLCRDKTRNDTNFKIVPSFIGRNETTVVGDVEQTYSFIDIFSKYNNIIEYNLILLFENGDEEICTNREIYKNIPFSFGVVDTSIGQPKILQTKSGIDIQFSIKSIIRSSNASILKKILEQQGQAELYSDELLEEKSSLDKIISHQIRRIDLTTGETVFFRPFTGTMFSDELNRKIDGIEPLVPGRVYRYIVSALLRSPETMFEKNYKNITNSVGISVQILPLKFKHPIVQKYGNIVTPTSLSANHSESQFEFENIGNFIYQDVSIDISKPQILDARVTKFNKETNILRWSVKGEKALLDHFLIILDRLGDEEIIGKVHTNFNSNIIEYIDKESSKEPGSYRYKIIPVLKDYSHGSSITTKEII